MTPDISAFSNLFNPAATLTDTRTWTDRDLLGRDLSTNGDDIAEDNEIPASSNPNFGKIQSRSLDPKFKREYNWQYSAGAQSLRSGDNTASHRAELHVRVGRRHERRDAE